MCFLRKWSPGSTASRNRTKLMSHLPLTLLPIDEDENKNVGFKGRECKSILEVYPGFYRRVGFNPPWIGYFVKRGGKLVGCGGFKGKPKDGKVEVSYGTFKKYEGEGIGSEICRQLVSLSLKTDPDVRVTARTLPENNASANILKKNGFELLGTVWDDEDGGVWEWELRRH